MRSLVVIVFFLLVCSNGFAAEQAPENTPQGADEAAAGNAEEKTEQDQARGQKQAQWPRPYQPREEISADVTVPFPTDI